jgi:predicted RNA-binding protein with PIN domain
MTNKIIIDGWNLAWKIPEIAKFIPDNLPRARKLLNTRLKNYYQQKKVNLKIIYDGKPGIIDYESSGRQIDIHFSQDPEKADHLIVKFLKKEKFPHQWSVITSDRELATKVRNAGALAISSDTFLRKFRSFSSQHGNNEAKSSPQLSKEEINFWLKKFRENDNEG